MLGQIRDRAKALSGRVALPEGTEERTAAAAKRMQSSGTAKPLLIGDEDGVLSACRLVGLNPSAVEIVDPLRDSRRESLAKLLHQRRAEKGMTSEQAFDITADPLYYGGLLLAAGDVDACVAGAVHTTGEVIRAGLHTVGTRDGITTVSGSM